ncbi:MAG: tetratricopeptide repeat protein [Nitrospinota bacterium]|nr:tetratricopeptide repeat protein [Nitrospinota bacterium]
MNPQSQKEYQRVRQHCGWFFLEDWCLVSGKGEDLFAYLQTQTTNDVLQLDPGTGQNSAIVDRMAKLIAFFSIHRDTENSVLFLIQQSQKETFLETLEKHLFREDVQLDSQPPQNLLLTIQGPKSGLLMQKLSGEKVSLPKKENEVAWLDWSDGKILILYKSFSGEEGFVLAFENSLKHTIMSYILEKGESYGLTAISPETQETLRLEAGLPQFGKDVDGSRILPETGLEHRSISYNKGCYIGQEVIARVKTYGAPAHALMGLVVDGNCLPAYGGEILLDSKRIGMIKSTGFSPALGKNIALAYINKDHRSPGVNLDTLIDGAPFKVQTTLLPFYQAKSRQDRARTLHTEALKFFKNEENLDKPIALLREAIELDPKYAQAYEALGVLLSKQNKLDEAIALMKRLAEIDTTEIMAHSNLSIYYMKQGRIEDAENEKAEATALQFEKLMVDSQAKKAKEKANKEKQQEQENKISMFKKVLEIDPADQVANFGIGSIYLENGRYEEALVHLKTLVEHFPDYSAAYLLLGKNLEKLSRKEEAISCYEKGIAAASKKGDLMPLQDMQNRRNQLLHSSKS